MATSFKHYALKQKLTALKIHRINFSSFKIVIRNVAQCDHQTQNLRHYLYNWYNQLEPALSSSKVKSKSSSKPFIGSLGKCLMHTLILKRTVDIIRFSAREGS